jgi:hypothetical protein
VRFTGKTRNGSSDANARVNGVEMVAAVVAMGVWKYAGAAAQ